MARNTSIRLLLVSIGWSVCGALGQGTVYVNGTAGNDDWSGQCEVWDGGTCGPKATIQAGIDAAAAGDQVLIADGIYTGVGNRDLDFGGKGITVRSASGNPATCVIDCEQQGRGFYFHTGESAASVVQGLTIRSGNSDYAGGVYCSSSSPTLVNCIIAGNTATIHADSAGGLYCTYSSPTLIYCQICGNRGFYSAGGVYCSHSAPRLVNCTISKNAGEFGGGLNCDLYSSPTLTNCIIRGNTADFGGGLHCDFSSVPVLTNCVIADNTGSLSGGGISCSSSSPALTNCTIAFNTTSSHGGGMYCGGAPARPTLSNCIWWGDTPEEIYIAPGGNPSVTYCDIQGGWAGTGNIDIDPGFAFASDPHLLPGSACIDAGTNSPPGGLPAQDIEDQPRAIDGDGDGQVLADMGAYEFNPAAPAIALSATELTFELPIHQSASQALGIRNSSLGVLVWQLEGGADWLSAEPSAAQSSGEINLVTLTADTQSLVHGRYDTLLRVTDPQASNSPRLVPLVLHVSGTLSVPDGYATIQAAIDAAVPGDEVVLADGVYTGAGNKNVDLRGKRITIRSASGDPAACVIDCQQQGCGFCLRNSDTVGSALQGLTIRNGNNGGVYCYESGATLTNCAITANTDGGVNCFYSTLLMTDCTVSGNTSDDVGGGVLCSDSFATLANCSITGNTADGSGGGVYCFFNSVTLTNCTITGNTGECGGGVYCESSMLTITGGTISGNAASSQDGGGFYCSGWGVLMNCTITGNSAARHGGGLYSFYSSPTATNCTISGNIAAVDGGAVYCRQTFGTLGRGGDGNGPRLYGGDMRSSYAGPMLINCAITNNKAIQHGGGVCCYYDGPLLMNCTLTGNTAATGGGFHCLDSPSTPTLTNCIFWADAPQEIYAPWCTLHVTYCDVQGGWSGPGNINADPHFADPDGPDGDPATWQDNDCRLSAGSPCIDSGDPAFVPLVGELELDGRRRVWDGDGDGVPRVDRGAYEFGSHAPGDLNCDALINVFDIDPFVLALTSAPGFEAYQALYPDCSGILADVNGDGAIDASDIDAFVRILTGG